jgi:hypothetical protein
MTCGRHWPLPRLPITNPTLSFTVDLAAKKVTKNGTEVHLTPTEARIGYRFQQ